MATLPNAGDLAWAGPLNTDILALQAEADATQTALANHAGNSPADPHGDRAYTNNLIMPLITGLNLPNGLVQLNAQGLIPANLMPGAGGLTNWLDVKKDFGATGNGSSDDASLIQAALDKASAAGSAVVWVPDGIFACGTTLYIGAGTWLLLSPGAIIKRIQHPTSPATMLCNYKPGSAASVGNIKITGGMFDAVGDGLTQNCSPFSFVNASNVRVEDLIIKNVSNGYSPYISLFGCHDVWVEDIEYQGAGPSGGRSYQVHPCCRIESTHPNNISGLVSGDYAGYPNCSDITHQHCKLVASVGNDSTGAFSAWTSMVGSIGNVYNGYHERITVTNNVGTGFSQAGISGIGWDNVVYNSNSFNYPPQPYILVGGGSSDINVEGNAPATFPVVPIQTVVNTITETIVFQFTIPANDWISGSSGYNFSCNGPVSWHNGSSLTLRVYIGIGGGTGDPKACNDIVHAYTGSGSGLWNLNSNDIHVDGSGNWWPGGWSFASQQRINGSGYNYFAPAAGNEIIITITAQWNSFSSSNSIGAVVGSCQRIHT